MQDSPKPIPNDSPSLIPLLPVLYLAWADGVLTPGESARIRNIFDEQAWLSEADRFQLNEWLDPLNPPSASLYSLWLRAIRRAASMLDDSSTATLVNLGSAMLEVSGVEEKRLPGETRRALEDLEAVLGTVVSDAILDVSASRPRVPERTIEHRLDVAKLGQKLDGTHAGLRARIRTLMADPVFGVDDTISQTDYREKVLGWCKILAERGLGGLAFPKSVGGGGDTEQFMVAFETLAFFDLSLVIKFGVQFGLFGGSIHQLGTRKHHEKFLGKIASLELPGSFAMTELGHGSNVRELETTATYLSDSEQFEIHTPSEAARKEYIGNAAVHGQLATVFAQLIIEGVQHGVHAFLVPLRNPDKSLYPGVRTEDNGPKLGLNGVDNGRIWFDHVLVPRDNLLDRFAQVDPDGTYHSPIPGSSKRFFTMLGTLVGGRISVASGALSATKSGLYTAIRYNLKRRQFGPKNRPETTVLDYPTQQRRLIPRLAQTYALHFALDSIREAYSSHPTKENLEKLEVLASGLKAYTTWFATETLQVCRETCGGQGYLAENRFAALKADTDIFTTFEGDNTVLLQQVAKGRLTEFKKTFQDLNWFGIVQYFVRETGESIRDKNPVSAHRHDSEHLRDREVQLGLFRSREDDQVTRIARFLRKSASEGHDSFSSFLKVQNDVVAMASNYVERVILEIFLDQIPDEASDLNSEVLGLLGNLFALGSIERDAVWFLENGYLDDTKSRAIRREVDQLCLEIRPFAGDLVDAFSIPESSYVARIVR